MINNLPQDIQEEIINTIGIRKKRLINTTLKLPDHISRNIINEIKLKARRIMFFIILKRDIYKLFDTIEKYLPSYSLCTRDTLFFPFNDECLVFAPINQSYPVCRYCKGFRYQHKYWKMMNLYFQVIPLHK